MLGRQAMLGRNRRRSVVRSRPTAFPAPLRPRYELASFTTAEHDDDSYFLELRNVDDLYDEAPNQTRYGNALLILYFAAMISSSTRNSGLNSCGIMRSMEAGRSSPRNRVRTFP